MAAETLCNDSVSGISATSDTEAATASSANADGIATSAHSLSVAVSISAFVTACGAAIGCTRDGAAETFFVAAGIDPLCACGTGALDLGALLISGAFVPGAFSVFVGPPAPPTAPGRQCRVVQTMCLRGPGVHPAGWFLFASFAPLAPVPFAPPTWREAGTTGTLFTCAPTPRAFPALTLDVSFLLGFGSAIAASPSRPARPKPHRTNGVLRISALATPN